MADFNYFEHELKKTEPVEGDHRVKFRGPDGETRWMGLSPDEYARVRDLMIEMGREQG